MNLMQALVRREERGATQALTVDGYLELLQQFTYSGHVYELAGQQTLRAGSEPIDRSFAGYSRGAYRANGVIFACVLVRMLLFAEARFQAQQLRQGRPGRLFGFGDLGVLERPWPGGTTGDLLARCELDVSLAGNAFLARPFVRTSNGAATRRREDRIYRLRPDWVTIVLGSRSTADHPAWAPDVEVDGYLYEPGGPNSGAEPVSYERDEVAHYAPVPDPEAHWRGMSWLTPLIREIEADSAATRHKLKFFENGATPNLVVTSELRDPEKFGTFVEQFRRSHEGAAHAYKTLFLGAGADAKPVGADLKQIEFKTTQGAGETRIAAAAGVPPVIVGLSEGLAAATYSNYSTARRRFADGTIRPLWRNLAGSLQTIVEPPAGARLWYDDRDIAFLQEDVKDAAEVAQLKAAAMRTLVDAGFSPETVVDAVDSGDLSRLNHSGLLSVQLQEPGAAGAAPTNGTGGRAGELRALELVAAALNEE